MLDGLFVRRFAGRSGADLTGHLGSLRMAPSERAHGSKLITGRG